MSNVKTVVNAIDNNNKTKGVYKRLVGLDDGTYADAVVQVGSIFAEQKTQANAVAGVLTFSEPISAIEIHNTDTANAGVFNVNGISITVPAGGYFPKSVIGGTPSNQVTITGATAYIVNRYI
jgi:hypothetical protein